MPSLDLRMVALGAVLSDLIDKPLGHVLLAGTLDNGRLLAHTLLFLAVFLTVGLLRANPSLIAISFGTAVHLGLDAMWNEPATLLWPLFGFGFPAEGFEPGLWLEMLARDPYTQLGELAGLLILAFLFLRLGLHRRGALAGYLVSGTMGGA